MGHDQVDAPTDTPRLTRDDAHADPTWTVRQTRRSRSFPLRWAEPTVIHVVKDDAWSAYLRRMTRRPEWTGGVARLAAESGIARSSIFKWIAEGAGSITIESVYRIADALGDDRANALRAAGNLPLDGDPEVELILASDRSERVKAALIDRLLTRREEERARRVADLEWMLGQGAPDDEAAS